jgi:hypothetical protein
MSESSFSLTHSLDKLRQTNHYDRSTLLRVSR